MKYQGLALLALATVFMGVYPSVWLVEGTQLTQSEYEEYISAFVTAISYQLPEPASTLSSLLFAAPEGTKSLLLISAQNSLLSTERNYQDAQNSGSKNLMDYYMNQSNRLQAVISCLNGDCSSMQSLEGDTATDHSTQGTDAGNGILVANKTGYRKGALYAGPISIPANWTDPQEVLFLDMGRAYIIVGEGTCSLWDNPPTPDGVDSCFCYAKWRIGDTPQIWGQLELIDPSIHLSELIEKNTGKAAEYKSSHVYEALVIGEGKPLKARIYDGGSYEDNHGELKVSVYQAIAAA